MILLALDPGVHTGYAVFDGAKPCDVGTIHKDHERALEEIVEGVRMRAPMERFRAVIEQPGSYGWHGKASASSIQALSIRIGFYQGLLAQMHVPVQLVSVNRWKGGKTKARVIRDMKMIYGPLIGEGVHVLDHNAWEALGLGHYALSIRTMIHQFQPPFTHRVCVGCGRGYMPKARAQKRCDTCRKARRRSNA